VAVSFLIMLCACISFCYFGKVNLLILSVCSSVHLSYSVFTVKNFDVSWPYKVVYKVV
jgi:hypothetical protein